MRLPAVTVQIMAIPVQVTFVFARFVAVAAQLGPVPPQFTMFPGDTCVVAFAFLLTQFTTIPVTFAYVAMSIATILTDIAAIMVQVFSVAAHVAVRRLSRLIGGINGGYRGKRQGGDENNEARFTHETCSPEVCLRKDENYFQVMILADESMHCHE